VILSKNVKKWKERCAKMNVTFCISIFTIKETQMKTKQFLMMGSSVMVILLLLIACGQAPSQSSNEATLTFSGDTCTYSGPKSLPAKFDINVVVEGQTDTVYGYVIVTLQEGKGIEDLQAWPSTDPPEWLKDQLNDSGPAFGGSFGLGPVKQNVDLGVNAAYAGEPFYFVCFADAPARKIGAAGPIEITK
jgi:hypothetical protein